MPEDLKTRFAKRIQLFFKFKGILIKKVNSEELIDHLYTEFDKQGRFKGKDQPFWVTPKFVLDELVNFLKIRPKLEIKFFRDLRSKRASTQYMSIPAVVDRVKKPRSKGLIELLGRKHKPHYKVTQKDGTSLTPTRRAKTKTHMENFNVSFSPVTLKTADKKPRQRAVSSDSSTYERDMVSDQLALWRKKTPHKGTFFSPDRIVTSNSKSDKHDEVAKRLSFAYDNDAKKNTTETFEFTVTRDDILCRVGVKRPIGQKRVMGDVSAFEVMNALGVIITEKQNGRNFHWAHRHGWSLKGGQTKDNFDPMTAGSNYDTLFKVETPLKTLLLDKKVEKVYVKGEVEFDKDSGLPFKITYKLSWGTKEFIEVVIDPMSHRVPTVDEHQAAESFFSLTLQ